MKKELLIPNPWGMLNVLFSGIIATVWLWIQLIVITTGISTALAGGLGLIVLFFWVLVQRGINVLERRRSEAIYNTEIPFPPRRRANSTGFRGWAETNIRAAGEAYFWRETALHFSKQVLGLFTLILVAMCATFATFLFIGAINPDATLIAFDAPARGPARGMFVVFGCLAFIVGFVSLWVAAIADRALDRWLLAVPQAETLKRELTEVDRARVGAVDAATTERLRIERDLHDGVQPTLVALSMKVGMAKAKVARDPEGAHALLEEAHSDSKAAITQLRELVRGIHPAVLTDRGLDAAVSALAARSAVPVTVNVDVPRVAPNIESVAYFVVAEALSNMGKHAQATEGHVSITYMGGRMRIEVRDNGRGGAQLSTAGSTTGLAGLAHRVTAARGTFNVHSPVGGPTVITVELPCE
ncbi:signal transduction histidine kinase [Brevibacterium paucivorans]|uniref:histidine kinase n=1 Tax=Brevibacterium paucivorans TaxID=170994 RepID=A0ABS2SJ45_9MICO|nr:MULTISPECIES: sensor histidine kinase [Brevibacterium]MBM7816283.1 signal transduction histidine kinase [Brevibacterium paucivorans]MCG7297476.1 sensor histidine kinase [Brevibacterium sp. ACRRH]